MSLSGARIVVTPMTTSIRMRTLMMNLRLHRRAAIMRLIMITSFKVCSAKQLA